jgi:hypothetical protein
LKQYPVSGTFRKYENRQHRGCKQCEDLSIGFRGRRGLEKKGAGSAA